MKRFTISLMFVLTLLLAVGSNDLKTGNVFGDLNGDDEVNVADINLLVDIILRGGSNPDPGTVHTPNMTIAEFKAKHWQDDKSYIDTITEDEVIHGWVTSSDEAGNIYKSLYITDESGAGLSIAINKRDLYKDYAIGQEIILPMKGYYVGKYNGQQQVGYPQWYAAGNTWEVTFMPQAMWESLVEVKGTANPDCPEVQPVEITLDELAGDSDSETLLRYQSKLVRITNVMFEEANGTTTFSESGASTNRTLADADGNTLIVRTSNYANFKDAVLPVGTVEVVGLLTCVGKTWQLALRDINDVVVPQSQNGVTYLNEEFDNSLPDDWSSVTVSGDKNWYHTAFQGNGYAAMTGYKGIEPPFDAWMITPALDIKNAASTVLTFTTQIAAYTSSTTQFEVYVLNSNDPRAATIKVKLNPNLASPSPTSTYSEVTPSGDIDLSQWADGVYYIGFRYYATADVNYATWCLDNVRFGEPSAQPADEAVLTLDEGFDESLPKGWHKATVSGDKQWYQTVFAENGYAAMSGYKGTQPPFDAWLITPALDIKNAASKVFNFRTEVNGYGSTTTKFEVYVLNSVDPSAATFKVKLNPVLATAPENGYSEWAESGDIDLSQWADGIYYIGFRYYATQDNDYATWCLDDVRFGF